MSTPRESTGASFGNARQLDIDEVTQLAESVAGARNTALLIILGSEFDRFSSPDVDQVYKDAFATQTNPYAQSGETITPPRASSQLSYTSGTLISLVGGSGTRWDPKTYSPTEFAVQRCRPFAGHVYHIAKKHDIAPADLVGHRSSPQSGEGLEQSMVRLALYGTILKTAREKTPSTNVTWSLSGLADAAELNVRTVHNQVDALCRAKILQPTYGARRNRYPNYARTETTALSDTELEKTLGQSGWNNNKRELTQWLVEQITSDALPDLKVATVWKAICEQDHIEQFFTTKQAGRQRAAVNDALDLLSQTGFLTADNSAVYQQVSALTLGETGKEVVEEYITTIGKIILGDNRTVAIGTRIADEAAKNKYALGWLLTVDQEKGAVETYKSLGAKTHTLREALSNGALVSRQICDETGWNQGATNRTLAQLEEQGVVRSRTEGRTVYWELCD